MSGRHGRRMNMKILLFLGFVNIPACVTPFRCDYLDDMQQRVSSGLTSSSPALSRGSVHAEEPSLFFESKDETVEPKKGKIGPLYEDRDCHNKHLQISNPAFAPEQRKAGISMILVPGLN
ncbi:hypothetical protein N7495_006189 [Penicillium taxi]|uniref:uncharacterized protein n=1 Tax=Penicillium taxi TaxID=168475 RepID=UPI00254525BC|nr:uncharacterized protein N7495_006189 [Penicillium taxi]KAJ5894498.1 hypothetical protein N7495_006189 [Penicillium taxi]